MNDIFMQVFIALMLIVNAALALAIVRYIKKELDETDD